MQKEEIFKIADTVSGTEGRPDYVAHIYQVVNQLPDNCTVLEIGTQNGGSATVIALTIKERGGKLHCIDPCFVPEAERPRKYLDYSSIGGCHVKNIKETFEKYGISDVVTLHAGTSEEILESMDKDIKFDFVYVDGCHEYKPVKIDLKWLDRTNDNAIAMFDDWIKPVKRAVDEYMTEHTNWKNQTDGSFFPIWFKKQ